MGGVAKSYEGQESLILYKSSILSVSNHLRLSRCSVSKLLSSLFKTRLLPKFPPTWIWRFLLFRKMDRSQKEQTLKENFRRRRNYPSPKIQGLAVTPLERGGGGGEGKPLYWREEDVGNKRSGSGRGRGNFFFFTWMLEVGWASSSPTFCLAAASA